MKKKFKCKFCSVKFKSKSSCSSHEENCVMNDSADVRFVCPYCGIAVNTKGKLQDHLELCEYLPNVLPFSGNASPSPEPSDQEDFEVEENFYDLEKQLKCEFCQAKFNYKSNCIKHKTNCPFRDSVGRFSCLQCKVDFATEDDLVYHLLGCNSQQVLYDEDALEASNEEDFRIEDLEEEEKQFKCKSCAAVFKHKINCTRHEKKCASMAVESFSCPHCETAFTKKDYLKYHLLECNSQAVPFLHEDVQEASNQEYLGVEHEMEKQFKCKKCAAIFEHKSNCTRHENQCTFNDSAVDRFPCPHCSAVFTKKGSLKIHLHKCSSSSYKTLETLNREENQVENVGKMTENDEKQFLCKHCGATFKRSHNCTRHETDCNVTEDSTFICHICGKVINNSCSFKEHLLRCGKSYKCATCPATFTTKSNSLRHEAFCNSDNSTTKSCICHVCGKGFNREDSLKVHLQRCEDLSEPSESTTTNSEKQFKCKTCPATFAIRHRCTRHEQYCKFNESATTFSCDMCGGTFSRKDNLNTHVQKCMKTSLPRPECSEEEDLEVEEELVNGKGPFKCRSCSAAFTIKSNRSRHEQNCPSSNPRLRCHFCMKGFQRNGSLQRHLTTCASSEQQTSTFQCKFCKFTCTRRFSLIRHKDNCPAKHNSSVSGKSKTRCFVKGCDLFFYHRTSLLNHLKRAHKDDRVFKETVRKEFSSLQEFISWKEAEEESSFSYFSKKSGTKSNISYYYCQHDGIRNDTQRKTSRVRSKGRIKNGNHCTARMKVKSLNDKVQVEYFPTHSHPCSPQDLIHHPLPQHILHYIDEQLQKEVSPAVIFSQIKNTFGKDNPDNPRTIKINRLTRKLIVERARKRRKGQRLHPDDVKSVDLLMLQKKEENSVLLYKPKGEHVVVGPEEINHLPNAEDLFLLGMQTPRQLELMKMYGSKILMINATDDTNRFEYQLLSCVVVDDDRRGWPVGHLITSSSDPETLKFFFAVLKDRLGEEKITCIITDDESTLVDGINKGFGTELRHLLCQWSVMRNLKENLKLTADKEVHGKILDELRVIMSEDNEIRFYTVFDGLEQKYQNHKKAHRFIDFFKQNYQNKPEKWATCHRNFAHGDVNTIGHVKAFQKRLKENYLKTKDKRLDDLVIALFKMEMDDHTSLMREQIKGFLTLPQPILERHERGLGISDNSVICVLDHMYQIVPKWSKNEIIVIKYGSVCNADRCHWKCDNKPCQDLCSHMYSCSCADRHPLCEHIHKIHTYLTGFVAHILLEEEQLLEPLTDQDGSLLKHFPQIIKGESQFYSHLLVTTENQEKTTPTNTRKRRLPETLERLGHKPKIIKKRTDTDATSTNPSKRKGLVDTMRVCENQLTEQINCENPSTEQINCDNQSTEQTDIENQINSHPSSPTLPSHQDSEESPRTLNNQEENNSEAATSLELRKKQFLLEKIDTHMKILKEKFCSGNLERVPDQFIEVLETSLSEVVEIICDDENE